MAKFHNIRVKDIYKETDDCSVITFDVPELATTEILLAAAKTIAVSAKPVTDSLAIL